MTTPEAQRRAGYAPENAVVGRRGQHTRERILACAAELFVADGYHGTAMEAIARAVGGSRAAVYQYFQSKQEIFLELAANYRPIVLAHARSLGRLGPDEVGLRELHRWLVEWAKLRDEYAIVFVDFPGVGTAPELADDSVVAGRRQYAHLISERLRVSGVSGIDAADAAAALMRIAHMINLEQFRHMFKLADTQRTTASLALAMQRMLFPNTADGVLTILGQGDVPHAAAGTAAHGPTGAIELPEADARRVSPIRQDILSSASALFSAQGFYSVSMEDIAASADVSRATLYRHFASKVLLLDELSDWSVLESVHLSCELYELAGASGGLADLRAWLGRYVHFHRAYGGIIQAWYDGAIARQLRGDSVAKGMRQLHDAVLAYLGTASLPPTLDHAVAAAIFLAVLGRLSEYASAKQPAEIDYEAAGFMLLVLQRALLGVDVTVRSTP